MAPAETQSTLRELRTIAGSRRLWLTFALVVVLFTVTGPFGTAERMFIGVRFTYWLILHAIAWSISIACAVIADKYLSSVIASRPVRMITGSLLAALPVSLALQLVAMAFEGRSFSTTDLGRDFIVTLPLCALFCLLTWLTMSNTATETVSRRADIVSGTMEMPEAAPDAGTPLLTRLKPSNRAALLRLSSEDHYTEVVTRRGRELVLIRFSDALSELGTTQGLRIHRSHWVADANVASLTKDAGRLFVLTIDGERIPVSRPYESVVRGRYRSQLTP